jgi:putative ABC transport system substrate-binding protein
MRRREFIALLGGAATWPLGARGQPQERMRHLAVLMPITARAPIYEARLGAFLHRLGELGWKNGQNIRIEIRASEGAEEIRKYAMELVTLAPDVILATGVSTVVPLQQVTSTVPIVFAIVPDPVGAGIVDSLARPGANVTGFTTFEYGLSGKWLELLKEVAPRTTRAAVMRNAAISAGIGQFAAIQSIAPLLGVELTPVNVRNATEIERTITEFARVPNAGLIVTGSALVAAQRELIVRLAQTQKLPAVYYERSFVATGGLVSYGPDVLDEYRQAAGYIDRILRGENPADLPVQAPTKYELVINMKTAKALGLDVPPQLLARADEVIE